MTNDFSDIVTKSLSRIRGGESLVVEADLQRTERAEPLGSKATNLNPNVEDCIRILRDNSQEENKRDKAMMDLAKYKEIKAIEALIASLSKDPAVTHYQPLRAAMALSQMNDKRTIPYLLNIIQNAEMQQGADALTPAVSSAIKILGNIGDKSQIKILETLKEKILKRGIKREYFNTGFASGTISTMDQIRVIDGVIQNLKKI